MAGWNVTKEALDTRMGELHNELEKVMRKIEDTVEWLARQDQARLEATPYEYSTDDAYLLAGPAKDELASFAAAYRGLAHLPKFGGLGSA